MKNILILGVVASVVSSSSFGQVVAVGDLSIIGFNSNTPDNFAFVPWVNVPNDSYIKFTDNGFLSTGSANAASNARGGENFVIWRNSTGSTITAGTVISIESLVASSGTASAGAASGLSGISNGGDQLFAYVGASTSGANPGFSANTNPTTFNETMIFGLNFGSSFLASGTPTSNTSYLPSELSVANGSIALSTASTSRGQYTGDRTSQTSLDAYRTLVNNPANWTTATGAGTITLDLTSFAAVPEPSEYAALTGAGLVVFALWRRRAARKA